MLSYNVRVNISSSGKNYPDFKVLAEDYVTAMMCTLQHLNRDGIQETDIDSLKISIDVFWNLSKV